MRPRRAKCICETFPSPLSVAAWRRLATHSARGWGTGSLVAAAMWERPSLPFVGLSFADVIRYHLTWRLIVVIIRRENAHLWLHPHSDTAAHNDLDGNF